MASSSFGSSIVALFITFAVLIGTASAVHLSIRYYNNSCPKLLSMVKDKVDSQLENKERIGASLLRLFFHDCFVNGCDGSILLDDSANFTGEKNAIPNRNSVRGFHVIDAVKSAVEDVCPGIVSCADILAIVARDSVVFLGGPSWRVKLGRRDSRAASQAAANENLPSPTSNLTELISIFRKFGFTTREMVALSGAHTIGKARCTNFRGRLYNDLDIDDVFAKERRSKCPELQGSGDDNLAPLDIQTTIAFDNSYYINIFMKMGLLHSDQQLFQLQNNGTGGGVSTDSMVVEYMKSQSSFFSDFAKAMVKMGDLYPLTGSSGEIRKNCRVIN
ncbi:hypothetical protein FEM48_Zijuj02G0037700 [Ziziphus jujuba var. spinosa]|uniref:Peroxidase n=1 Tax=Ziziphus jujuba var. spinosa TaxID=714518 RepID=A0A978VTF8_ZIZJJ|nr:peroxidase P7-like [Ziziphus jujuba var. spinosa]KAH7542103.1 hypothetical protein FEM48_Zijuj02G0037700 [Ziziphus jujuba var. spinosa]